MTSVILYSPSGVVAAAPLRRAASRLTALGFQVEIDASALASTSASPVTTTPGWLRCIVSPSARPTSPWPREAATG